METFEQILDGARAMAKRRENRLTLNDPRLVKRYLEGELILLVNVTTGADQASQYRIGLQLAQEGAGSIGASAPIPVIGQPGGDQYQIFVFVDVVHLGDGREQTTSLVRIGGIQDFDRLLRRGLFCSLQTGFKTLGTEDGEVSIVAVKPSDALPCMVKAAPQVVEYITSDCAPDDRQPSNSHNPVMGKAVLNVTIEDCMIRAAFAEGSDPRLKVANVHFGPFEFDETSGRFRHL